MKPGRVALHLTSIAGTQQVLPARLSRRYGLRHRPPVPIEVIVMTTNQPVRRALSRSLHGLRKMHNEQMYMWERFSRIGLPPESRAQAAAKASGDQAAGSDSPVLTGAGSGDRAR